MIDDVLLLLMELVWVRGELLKRCICLRCLLIDCRHCHLGSFCHVWCDSTGNGISCIVVSHCSSRGQQICYFVRTCLVPMWLFPKLGVVGMPLGWTGVDWSTSVLLWACISSLWDRVGIVMFVWWGQAHWLGVAVSCTDIWRGLQSLGRWCIFWTGFQVDPVGYMLPRSWHCFGTLRRGWACRTLLPADRICHKWSLSSSNLLLAVLLGVQLWKHSVS